MPKLHLCPLVSDYAVDPGQATLSVRLDGGRSRFRRDILNPAPMVNVAWNLGRDEYDYFEAFYNTTIEQGALPFQIDLIIGNSQLQEYTAHFVPGSKKLAGYQNGRFKISAQLEVEPVPRDADADADIVDAWDDAHS
jgi:hypothetical protein